MESPDELLAIHQICQTFPSNFYTMQYLDALGHTLPRHYIN